jgi:hypothetical protein
MAEYFTKITHRLDVVPVDVDDGHVEALGHVGAVRVGELRAEALRVRREGDLSKKNKQKIVEVMYELRKRRS